MKRLKVTGGAKYTYDRRFNGMLFARMLRCPHGSAKVRTIDVSKAKALSGVHFVEAYADKTIRFAGDAVAPASSTCCQRQSAGP